MANDKINFEIGATDTTASAWNKFTERATKANLRTSAVAKKSSADVKSRYARMGQALRAGWMRTVSVFKAGFAAIKMASKVFAGMKRRAMLAFNGIKRAGRVIFRGLLIGATAAVTGIGFAIKRSFDFEAIKTQFKVLLGTLDKAKERMAELETFSAVTPFQFEDIAKASKTLDVFSNNILGSVKHLKRFGDAAAATGADLQLTTRWVGRMYLAVKNGDPFGRAAMRLTQLGLVTGDTVREMNQLRDSGASNITIWNKFSQSFDRFEGGMDQLSKTGKGLSSTLKDNLTLAVKDFGDEFQNSAKFGIRSMINWIQRLRSEGTITLWALKAVDAIDRLKNSITRVINSDGFKSTIDGLKEISAGAMALGFKGSAIAFGDIILAAMKDGADYAGFVISESIKSIEFTQWARNFRFLGHLSGGATKEEARRLADKGPERGVFQSSDFLKNAIAKVKSDIAQTTDPTGERGFNERKAIRETKSIMQEHNDNLKASNKKREGAAKEEEDRAAAQAEIEEEFKIAADKKLEGDKKIADAKDAQLNLENEIRDLKKQERGAAKMAADAEKKAAELKALGPAEWVKQLGDQRAAAKEKKDADEKTEKDFAKARKKLARLGPRGISKKDAQILQDAQDARKQLADAQLEAKNKKAEAVGLAEEIKAKEAKAAEVQNAIKTATESMAVTLEENLREGS